MTAITGMKTPFNIPITFETLSSNIETVFKMTMLIAGIIKMDENNKSFPLSWLVTNEKMKIPIITRSG